MCLANLDLQAHPHVAGYMKESGDGLRSSVPHHVAADTIYRLDHLSQTQKFPPFQRPPPPGGVEGPPAFAGVSLVASSAGVHDLTDDPFGAPDFSSDGAPAGSAGFPAVDPHDEYSPEPSPATPGGEDDAAPGAAGDATPLGAPATPEGERGAPSYEEHEPGPGDVTPDAAWESPAQAARGTSSVDMDNDGFEGALAAAIDDVIEERFSCASASERG